MDSIGYSVPKTCFRCGAQFNTDGNSRVCVKCRAIDRDRKPEFGMKLSKREEMVARCVVRGLANKEIAWELKLTEGTIKEYLNRMFRKLGIRGRVMLALWAKENLG